MDDQTPLMDGQEYARAVWRRTISKKRPPAEQYEKDCLICYSFPNAC